MIRGPLRQLDLHDWSLASDRVRETRSVIMQLEYIRVRNRSQPRQNSPDDHYVPEVMIDSTPHIISAQPQTAIADLSRLYFMRREPDRQNGFLDLTKPCCSV